MSAMTDYHLPKKAEDLTGKRFGILSVIRFDRRVKLVGSSRIYWLCKCDCGNVTSVLTQSLKKGATKSCGCGVSKAARTHGMSKKTSPYFSVYKAFQGMHSRCKQTSGEVFDRYKGRGIGVCERWSVFENFVADMFATWKPGLSLDRIDNDRGYSPENCRWATNQQQNSNRRGLHRLTFKGETLTLTEWCRKLGLGYGGVLIRIRKGLPVDQILSPSLRKRGPLPLFQAHCL